MWPSLRRMQYSRPNAARTTTLSVPTAYRCSKGFSPASISRTAPNSSLLRNTISSLTRSASCLPFRARVTEIVTSVSGSWTATYGVGQLVRQPASAIAIATSNKNEIRQRTIHACTARSTRPCSGQIISTTCRAVRFPIVRSRSRPDEPGAAGRASVDAVCRHCGVRQDQLASSDEIASMARLRQDAARVGATDR
jgi:hypothetical protein